MAIPGLDFSIGDTVTYLGKDAEVLALKDGGRLISIRPKGGSRARWVARDKLSVEELPDELGNLAEKALTEYERYNPSPTDGALVKQMDAMIKEHERLESRPDPSSLIYKLLSDVMAEVGSVGKGSKASDKIGGYKFRGIDAVMLALQPALIKCGVIVLPEVLDCTHSEYAVGSGKMQHYLVKVRYTFYAPDGSSVSCVAMGEGADKGDKGVNKAMAGAMKYAITQSLSIPTEERKDSEHDETDLSQGERVYPAENVGSRHAPAPPPERTARVEGYLSQAAACGDLEQLDDLAKEVAMAGLTFDEREQIKGPWYDIKAQLLQGA